MTSIDINCDMGEGMPNDAAIMPFISSANIACGYHAGDKDTIKRTVELCLEHGVAIGAHPSFLDRENFGRIDLIGKIMRREDLPQILVEQIGLLQAICSEFGTRLHHVKPHGALYNRAAWDSAVSSFICTSIKETDPLLVLYGLSNSEMQNEATAYNIRFCNEVFADRTYQDDGSLTPRTQPNALIENEDQSIQQVLQMIKQQSVISVSRKTVPIRAESICIHGDGKHAVAFAQLIHQSLNEQHIAIKAI